MTPFSEIENSRIYNMDCVEGMKQYPDKFFDLAICDPPYGIKASNKNKYHANAFTTYTPKEWDANIPSPLYFKELFRVSKEQIIFGANYFTKFLPSAANWIVWDKKQPEGISFSMHELAFYSGKGQAKIVRQYNGANRCTVKEKASKYVRIHQTQKPIALYKWLLKNYAKQGDKILDTHLGSGSSRIAAWEMDFDFTGFEIDTDYLNAMEKRFKNHIAQQKLFV